MSAAIFELSCPNCLKSFNIESDYLGSRQKVKCPNCENELPQNKLDSLNKISKNLKEIKKLVQNNDYSIPGVESKKKWQIKIETNL